MISVVGGTYWERCVAPDVEQTFGSGGRAAFALAHVADLEFHTYLAASIEPEIRPNAERMGIKLHGYDSPHAIAFQYMHPLATPSIWPSPARTSPLPSIDVKGASCLRFGMLEGAGRVSGERVVYDPQSMFSPERFAANGSSAQELAVVLNRSELKLAYGDDLEIALRTLQEAEDAAVVIVKQGPLGALVVTRDGRTEIPAYQGGEALFTIGSGDIFAATFTYYWAEQRLEPVVAADLASKAAALYCQTRSLPIPTPSFVTDAALQKATFRPGRVYLAGPFFNLAQRWLVEEARRDLLGVGLEVFSPVHDVGRGDDRVARADLEGLDKCDRVYALVDGCDPGTHFEVGLAHQRGLPVVAFAESASNEDLKMLRGVGCSVVHDYAASIYRTCWLP